jgi:hypothetical protein
LQFTSKLNTFPGLLVAWMVPCELHSQKKSTTLLLPLYELNDTLPPSERFSTLKYSALSFML